MVLDQAVTTALSIGVGCRAGCPADEIAALVERAWGLAGRQQAAQLFSVADKRGEVGLATAAATLGLPLAFLPRETLAAVAPQVATASPASRTRFALPSIAEAAALAGAGPGGRLIVARLATARATCAVAVLAQEGTS